MGIYELEQRKESTALPYVLWISVPLVSAQIILSISGLVPTDLVHSALFGLIVSMPFIAYWWIKKLIKNRLGWMTFLLLVPAVEYIAVYLYPPYAFHFLGSALSGFPDIQTWNGNTGLTGVSAWIVIGNLGVFHVFFEERVTVSRALLFIYLIILLALPIIISTVYYPDMLPIQPAKVAESFMIAAKEGTLDTAGERFGRSCAWVSVLLITYLFVKLKISK